MLYCPKCRAEYTDVATECADCNMPLVAERPEEVEGDEEENRIDWVQIARLTSREYAEMLIETLRSKDIPAVILSGAGYFGHIGAMGATAVYPAGGGCSIAVPQENVAEADAEGAAIFGEAWDKARLIDIEP